MAAINVGSPAGGLPWRLSALLDALLHGLGRTTPRPAEHGQHYPPHRDRAVERAAMSREMYRL